MLPGASLILPVFNLPMRFLPAFLVGICSLVRARIAADPLTARLSGCAYRAFRLRPGNAVAG